MSHNVKLTGVKITDMAAMTRAVNEIKLASGENMALVEEKTYRGWGSRTLNNAEYVLKMYDRQYDIGFVKRNDKGSEYYEINVESDAYDVAKVVGAEQGAMTNDGKSITGTAKLVGRLLQSYNLNVAEMAARRSGKTSRRVTGENGVVHLHVAA